MSADKCGYCGADLAEGFATAYVEVEGNVYDMRLCHGDGKGPTFYEKVTNSFYTIESWPDILAKEIFHARRKE